MIDQRAQHQKCVKNVDTGGFDLRSEGKRLPTRQGQLVMHAGNMIKLQINTKIPQTNGACGMGGVLTCYLIVITPEGQDFPLSVAVVGYLSPGT